MNPSDQSRTKSENSRENFSSENGNTQNQNSEFREKIAPNVAADHARSVHDYPEIDFAPNEYVVIDVERSKFGIFLIWATVFFVFAIIFAMFWLLKTSAMNFGGADPIDSANKINLLIFAIAALCGMGGALATFIFNNNHFVVTNQRIFSRKQIAPFAYHIQTIEIEHVEDCSYNQSGAMPTLFGYGTLRLSTVGDEQTYNFTFVKNPDQQFKIINRVVHQVDEGEPTKYHGHGQK